MLNFKLRVPSQGTAFFHVVANMENCKKSNLYVINKGTYSFRTRNIIKTINLVPQIGEQNAIYNFQTNTTKVYVV